MQAQRIQCGCRATQTARARERTPAPVRTLTSFNHWYLLSGVPAMFVTVWATVRAVYADTEWVRISHNSVIVTFTVCSPTSLEGQWEPPSGTFIIKCQGCCYSELISKSFCVSFTFRSFKPLNLSYRKKKKNIDFPTCYLRLSQSTAYDSGLIYCARAQG